MKTPNEALPCFRKQPKQRVVAREGYLYIVFGIIVTSVVWTAFSPWAAFPFLVLTFYFFAFFRNPNREGVEGEGLIISPADGKILKVEETLEPKYLKSRAKRITIFMSPLNCHINRSPIDGEVIGCFYKNGSFKAAFREKAMEHNEHHAVILRDQNQNQWLVVQIAGFLARRIVSYVRGGEHLWRGERFGLIQFGSRVELFCPTHCNIFVKPGDKVYAGKTILGVAK